MLCNAFQSAKKPLKLLLHVWRYGPIHVSPYMVPLAHLILHPKWHLDWFSWFCTAHGRQSLYFTMGRPFPPSKLCLHIREIWTTSNTRFLVPTQVHTPKSLQSVQPFLQGSQSWQTDKQTTTMSAAINHIYVVQRCVQQQQEYTHLYPIIRS